MRVTPLDQGWEFRTSRPNVGFMRPNAPPPDWRPAIVPGCIHDDLIRNGIIADPFQKQFEEGCQWVGEEDWTYRTTFEWRECGFEKKILRFEGLDTVCCICLNEKEVARHDNMFLPLEIDVSETLKVGRNVLEVHIESAVSVGMGRRKQYFDSNAIKWDTAFFDERAFVRKAQYMSGWDWGPRLVTCGIWRSVKLLAFDSRIESFTIFQQPLEDGSFRVWSETNTEGNQQYATTFDGNVFEGDFEITIEEPKLWCPNGEGDPHLYEASARTESGHEIRKRVGLRTINLLRTSDAHGESFEFEINGRRVWARGANWIPNDSFPSRVSPEDYREQLTICRDLGMNMVRVWGGGIYESDAFYDCCDELGLMVWQDFPYACSYYPDSNEHLEIAKQEAEFHVRRLRDRSSLAIWCGNNENDVMWQSKWGGIENSPKRYFGDAIYGETLSNVCKDLDPQRPYIRSSPVGGQDETKAWGNAHYWDVWHGRGDWRHYAESRARFCSEFGFASACGNDAWKLSHIDPREVKRKAADVRWHDKTGKPWDVFRNFVELHYPASESLEDWIYYSQLNQRDALRFGIEHYRMNGACRGAIVWQFNDCWPVQSWAVQDYSRELKPAGFELQRLFAPLLLSIRIDKGEIALLVANDGAAAVEHTATLQVLDLDGELFVNHEFRFELQPNERKSLARIASRDFDKPSTVVRANIVGTTNHTTWRTLDEPKNMRWKTPAIKLTGNQILVEGLAYDLVLQDAESGSPVLLSSETLKGTRALAIHNETISLQAIRPKRIRARCMAGTQFLD